MQIIINKVAEFLQTEAIKSADSRRIFHGRGRSYPGFEQITVDYFSPVLLVTLFREHEDAAVDELRAGLAAFIGQGLEAVLLQRRYAEGAPTETLLGQCPSEVYASRGSLRFFLPLAQQQNTGFFLDMEPAREWLDCVAAGKRVLNLFAYTCAFSVVAVNAGAARVVNVDMSRRALELGKTNHRLNNLSHQSCDFLVEDILKSWGRIKRRGPYDLVIIDPPSYQKGSFVAAKDYAKVIRRIPELMPAGGEILACLNAPELGADFLAELFAEHCASCQFVERISASKDFPDIDADSQLKVLVYRYLPEGGDSLIC